MTIAPTRLLLLDSSVFVDLARNTKRGRLAVERFQLLERPEKPLFSTISAGEVQGLALYLGWGEARRRRLDELLAEFVRVEAGHPAIIAAYAELYSLARPKGLQHGQNDLWIAASAKATGAALITADHDFSWLNGDHLEVHFVEQPQ